MWFPTITYLSEIDNIFQKLMPRTNLSVKMRRQAFLILYVPQITLKLHFLKNIEYRKSLTSILRAKDSKCGKMFGFSFNSIWIKVLFRAINFIIASIEIPVLKIQNFI